MQQLRDLLESSVSWLQERWEVEQFNGGTLEQLAKIAATSPDYDAILWAPNVSNDEEKIIQRIKLLNPRCILIETKRNDNDRYRVHSLVAHMLKNHANLMLELTKYEGLFEARLLDPLGNLWMDQTFDIRDVANALSYRVNQLVDSSRIRSVRLGPAAKIPQSALLNQFVSQVRKYGNKFHELVHGANTTRFLGNYAFRCLNGFPAVRDQSGMYISPRNVDKRGITTKDFVKVEVTKDLELGYYGDHKPSVDAPIQVGLFNHYPKVRFMLHAHVYIKGARKTEGIVPCGALQEVDLICRRLGWPTSENDTFFALNLRGHGCIAMASEDRLSDIDKLEFVARPMLEDATGFVMNREISGRAID